MISSVVEDLPRRDFAANALAYGISGPAAGQWLDPCQGRGDIKGRALRALSERSFEDDPTRILRALRLSVRLGFTIEKNTLGWLLSAQEARMLERVSWQRCATELLKALEERPWRAVLFKFRNAGIEIPVPLGKVPNKLIHALERASAEERLVALYARGLISHLQKRPLKRLLSTLEWPQRSWGLALAQIERLALGHWRLSETPLPLTMFALKIAQPDWARALAKSKPCFLGGDDLAKLGVHPKERSKILAALFKQALEGRLRSRAEALKEIRKRVIELWI